jgi:hypothetical protein
LVRRLIRRKAGFALADEVRVRCEIIAALDLQAATCFLTSAASPG